jgi:hypothetical protein
LGRKKHLCSHFESPKRFIFLIFLPLWDSFARTPARCKEAPEPGFIYGIKGLAPINHDNRPRNPNWAALFQYVRLSYASAVLLVRF